jgi:hypothetical protein
MFQTLLTSQREALARDWEAGKQALRDYQQDLRREIKFLRRKSLLYLMIRAARTFMNEHPAGLLLLLSLLALAVVTLRPMFTD